MDDIPSVIAALTSKIDLLHILLEPRGPFLLNPDDAQIQHAKFVSDKLFSLGLYAFQSANTLMVNAARKTVCKCASMSTALSSFELASTSTALSSFEPASTSTALSSFEISSPDSVIQHFSLPGSPNQNCTQESQIPETFFALQSSIQESQRPESSDVLLSNNMSAYTQHPLIRSLIFDFTKEHYLFREGILHPTETIDESVYEIPRHRHVTKLSTMPNIDPPMSTEITDLFDLCHELILHWSDTDFCRKAKQLLVRAAIDPEAPLDTETERYISRQLSNMAALALGGILCTEYCDGKEYPLPDKTKLIQYTRSALRHLTMSDRMIDSVAAQKNGPSELTESLTKNINEKPLKKRKYN